MMLRIFDFIQGCSRCFVVKILVFLLLMISANLTAGAQNYASSQNKIKAIYVYNFIKYVRWPAYASNGEMKVCALTDKNLYAELFKLSLNRRVNDRKIVVENIGSLTECFQCDLIYISKKYLSAEMARDEGCKSFIVTDGEGNPGLPNASLVYQDNKLAFRINESLCDSQGYFIASQLKSLAL